MTMVAVEQETFDLSGFGGGYEDMCQRMLWRGVAYLSEARPLAEIWDGATESPGIYGVMSTAGEGLKALEAAIMNPGDDVTGAMHQCVMGHLRYIHQNGLDGWREFMRPHRGNSYIWTGAL